MRYFIKIVFLFSMFLSIDAKEYSFGLDADHFVQVAQADSKIALALWVKELAEKENILMNVKYYENDDFIIDDYLKDNLDIMVNNFNKFYEYEEKILKNSLFLWTISVNQNNKMFSYCILVNKNSKIKSIKDIKDKKLSIKDNDIMAQIWLNKLSYEINHKSYSDLVAKKIKYDKTSSMILSLFFDELDFIVVPKHYWEDMIKLNPSIGKKVFVLIESESIFVPIVGVVKKEKNIDKDIFMKIFLNTASRAEETARLQQIRELIKYQKIFILEDSELDKLKNLYIEYLKFKKMYE